LLLKLSSFCRDGSDAMIKIDPGYKKQLQIALALADRDHIFYHGFPSMT